MIGTPRNERYGSSPASRKYLKRGCMRRVGDDLRLHLFGDQAGQPLGQPHADWPTLSGRRPTVAASTRLARSGSSR